MSPPIRSFLRMLTYAALAGVLLWRENVWQSRARQSGAPKGGAGVTPGETLVPGQTVPGMAGVQNESDLLSQNGVLQRNLNAADAKIGQLMQEVDRLKVALEASKPPPTPESLASQFAEQRGLAFEPPPEWKPVPLETILEKTQQQVVENLPESDAQLRQRAAVAMGFHSEPFDYLPAVVSLAQMTNGGIFEPETRTFFYREEASLARADGREAFIGGLSAALTLQKGGGPGKIYNQPNDDAALALRSLMSGDANASRVRFSIADQMNLNFDRSGAPTSPPPNYSAPVYLAEIWKFSQDKGSLFVEALSQTGGNAAVDAAYSRPPKSSAEILHPEELYLSNPPFEPLPVEFSNPEVAGQSPYFTNVAGELGTYIVLRSWLTVDEATVASEGWAGDRYAVWEGPEGIGDHFAWKSVWRTEQDAREAFDQMRRVAMQRFSIPWRREYDQTKDQFQVDDPQRIIRLKLSPDSKSVLLTHATDPAFAAALEAASASW